MKNVELKTEFYRKVKRGDFYTSKLLHLISAAEDRFNKELYDWSPEEMSKFLTLNFYGQENPAYRAVSVIRQYNRFYKAKHKADGVELPDSKNYQGLGKGSEAEVWGTMYASPEHLSKVMDETFSPVDAMETDLCIRGYLWLAYAELDDEDAVAVRENDLDFEHSVIRFRGKEYQMYKPAIDTFRRLSTAREFNVRAQKDVRRVNRAEGSWLLRGRGVSSNKEDLTVASMRATLSRVNLLKSRSFSYNNVRYSGMFYRLYQKEKSGGTVLPEDYISFEDRRHLIQRNDKAAADNRAYREGRRMVNRYKIWKKAFHK